MGSSIFSVSNKEMWLGLLVEVAKLEYDADSKKVILSFKNLEPPLFIFLKFLPRSIECIGTLPLPASSTL